MGFRRNVNKDNPAQTLSGGSVGLAPIPSNSTGTPTMMDDQTSQHVTSTSEAEVLSVAEEPGHAEIADEWSDDAFQDLVRDSSEWGADVLNSLSCIFSDFNVNNLQTPVCVATDLSVDVLQATVCATSDCRVPVRDVAYYRANIPRVPVRDVAYYRANIPRVPVREVAYDRASVPRIPVCDVADCSVDVPQVPVSTTSAPGLDVADCPVDVPQVTVCAISDCRDDAPQVTVCATSDCRDDVPQVTVCAISDCRDDVPQVTVCATSDCRDDAPQVTVCATSDCRDDVPQVTVCATSDCGVNVPHDGPTGDTVSPQLKQLVNEIIDIGSCSYEIGRKLGEGGFGSVYAGICLKDGLEVALKFADKVGLEWIDIEGHPEPVPQEIGLLILANKGPWVPEIIQLLDWVEEAERYIMVLELPTPCENLIQFLDRHEGDIEEKVAKAIMKQATLAAQACCQRGVLHRDIKLENLLINPDTLEVKLIDFGCGEILTNAGYTSFAGTEQYCPPEFDLNGEYHGEPATVWSLGIVLFALMCGQFPKSEDLDELNYNIWTKDGLSQERSNTNGCVDVGFYSYEIIRKLGEGDFGSVYAGVRLDGFEVALKFADKVGIEWIDIEGHPEPVPQEIGLLILANKGPWVPQIIQLLDWVEEPERYIMVLELPTPCENLFEFLDRHEGTLEEDVVKAIMKQATLAAQVCCQRGVLHCDIKLENLLINPDTLEVKLIDFGCGEILTNAGYTSFAGTKQYCPPEYDLNGEYHGEPATVWSLGILLFVLMCGQFPESEDLVELNYNIWTKDGLSQDVGFSSYEIIRKLGEGGFGSVYSGIRLKDGLEVALKFADKGGLEWIDIEGHPEPVPQEIGLLILANKGPRVPQIIQLLDWVEEPERYIMVLELPTPCENLFEFLDRHEGTLEENVVKAIMKQATLAAQTCCQRGVLHRDIKLENLLINLDTLEVKLIDFGCGEILTNAGYTSFAGMYYSSELQNVFLPGTKRYRPPEFDLNGEYHGEPATVWSLGILLFVLLVGNFPKSKDLDELNYNIWTKDGLSQGEILISAKDTYNSKSYKIEQSNTNGCVALKFADKVGIEWIDIVSTLFLSEGHPEPVPQEIGLLILANKGPWVPQIIQLLDWVEEEEQYIMVLELPTPCENLFEFLDHHKGTLEENVVKAIMKQATLAAQACCQRGVLHRDIKLENLLINPDTLEVKLIDFGCGEILTNAGYTSFAGTELYCPPEFDLNGEYHGEPATVWSLGIVLFELLCGHFPESEDLDELNDNIWTKDGLSQDSEDLDELNGNSWTKDDLSQDVGFSSYEIGRKLQL
ncbi:unnamed protein product [Leuciscus chuanchicus]